jgi:hypothetical protein
MTILWWTLRALGLGLLVVGAVLAAFTGMELYMLLSGQVQPGEPMYVDLLANPRADAAIGLAKALALIAAGVGLGLLARTKAAAMRTRP